MERSTKYNQYAARIPKGVRVVGVFGSLSFNVQRKGVFSNSDPFGQTGKGGKWVQKLDIFHGCYKIMVTYMRA